MHVSAKTEYACIAVVELAANYDSGKLVTVRDLAESNGIPSRFLVQILLQLKAAGIIGSTRGASGGYRLLKPPDSISLADVMAVCDGQVADPVANAGREGPIARSLMQVWREVTAVERDMLRSITLADLLERARDPTENMYYI